MVNPVVDLDGQGKVRGKTGYDYNGDKYFSFLGIPYAKAPVGDLRFKAPEPAEAWDGIFDATRDGVVCPSTNMMFNYYLGKEDNCLNLNVFTKQLPSETTKPRPVMFWIHGGAFHTGSNRVSEMYDPTYLLTEDIILVSINYRLGALGFMNLEDSSLGVTGNAGLKDQVMALRWVQKHIEKFNGDPNNVTIFGESAGGVSVHLLILSPLAKGLFHKAIMQSGTAFLSWIFAPRGPDEILKWLNYTGGKNDKEILNYLRSLPAKKIVSASQLCQDNTPTRLNSIRYNIPIIEKPSPGALITEFPEDIVKSGNYNHVPMIIGFNSNEGLLFQFLHKITPCSTYPATDFITEFERRLNLPSDEQERRKLAEKVKKMYNFNSENDLEKNCLLTGDTYFIHLICRTVKFHLQTANKPIFFYQMSIETELNLAKKMFTATWHKIKSILLFLTAFFGNSFMASIFRMIEALFSHTKMKGASHSDDVFYLFKTVLNPYIRKGSIEEIGMRRFVKLWTNFARDGNPTPDRYDDLLNVKWPVTDKNLTYLNIDKELKIEKQPYKERMQFWEDIYDQFG